MCRRGAAGGRRHGFGQLDVGGVVRIRAVGDGVFARIRQHVKLVRTGTANRAGIRRNGAELQAKAGENTRIRLVHRLISLGQAGEIGVEGIRVLHHEFTRAHHAETGSDFIAELGLNLVEIQRQLAVAFDLTARDVGDDLFVGRAETKIALVSILDFQHLRAEHFPAPGFLP